MKKLIKNTGKKCSACNGDILVNCKYYSKLAIPESEVVFGGGPSPIHEWIKTLFFCEDCGCVFQPTKKNKLKEIDQKTLLGIFSNYYEIELNEPLIKYEFLRVSGERRFFLNNNFFIVGKHKENSSFEDFDSLLEESETFLCLFKTKDPIFWNKFNELNLLHKKKVEELKERLQEKLNANKIKKAFKFAEKYGFSLHCKKSKEYSIGMPLGRFGWSNLVKNPEPPEYSVPASKVFVIEDDFNISEYWIPTSYIKK